MLKLKVEDLCDLDIFKRWEKEISRERNESRKLEKVDRHIKIVSVTYGIRQIQPRAFVLTIFCISSIAGRGLLGGGGFHLKGVFKNNEEVTEWIKGHPVPVPRKLLFWEAVAYVATIERRYKRHLGEKLFYGR